MTVSAHNRAAKVHFGIHEIDESELPVDVEDLKKSVEAALGFPNYTPPMLPKVAVKVLEASSQVNISMRAVVALFEEDPLLAGRVLKVARSASFVADASSVKTLQDAVVRLGLKTVRNIVMEISMGSKVFRVDGYSKPMEALRRHSSCVARVAKIVARQVSLDTDEAFMSGLFHDVGISAALLALWESKKPPFIQAWSAAVASHEWAGQRVTSEWRLPELVQVVVGMHHASWSNDDRGKMAAAICVADAIACDLGASPTDQPDLLEPRNESQLAQAKHLLDLDEGRMRVVLSQAKTAVEEVEG
jgi:HD-like signal output (HDOD) protein